MRRARRTFALLLALCSFLPIAGHAQGPAPESAVFGPYPQNYQEIVTAWLNASLVDPTSIQLKWLGPPKPGKLPSGKKGEAVGYLVEFTVNARNIFGALTGPQKHIALLRDGQVITATGFVGR